MGYFIEAVPYSDVPNPNPRRGRILASKKWVTSPSQRFSESETTVDLLTWTFVLDDGAVWRVPLLNTTSQRKNRSVSDRGSVKAVTRGLMIQENTFWDNHVQSR
jgi:hypothetical protein